jgi:coenzyme F420-reducing hydrogenase alpha subunit
MATNITLPAVKRIEGHGRVTLTLDDSAHVADAHFDVLEFRGFEKLLEGRMVWEMPLITSRICGVCPVSHHLAAVKAVDALYHVEIPYAARLLRELMHLGAFAQDHALHYFFLAGPDFLTGDGSGSRDLLGVIEAQPEVARKAIALRRSGQRIVEIIGGRTSHPVTAIPGGMSRGIDADQRAELSALVREMTEGALMAAELAVQTTARLIEEHPGYADAPVHNVAQLADGRFDIYDGRIHVMDPSGELVDTFDASDYASRIGERTLDNSYANSPYLISGGPEEGLYRVGPLARLNMVDSMPGPRSQAQLDEYRAMYGKPVHAVLAYHHARMIELVASVERMSQLLQDDEITSDVVRVKVERGEPGVGIAAIEAPRGTLIHHYEADPVGKVLKANLIVATTHNVGSLDRAVLEAVVGESQEQALSDETVRKMELGIRAHDPCLSCATHEIGRMPIAVALLDAHGKLIGERGVG